MSGSPSFSRGSPGVKMGGAAFARSLAFPGVGQRRAAAGSGWWRAAGDGGRWRAAANGDVRRHVSTFERCCFQLVKRSGGNNRVTRGLHTECGPLTFSGGLIIQTKDRI